MTARAALRTRSKDCECDMITRVETEPFRPLTPHTKAQLQMADYSDLTERGDEDYILLMDKNTGRYRPAVVLYPDAFHAEIHTAEDYSRKQRCKTQRQWEALEPHVMVWDPRQEVKSLIWNARNGLYNDQAKAAGFDSPISYILSVVEEREEEFQHHKRKNPHVTQEV